MAKLQCIVVTPERTVCDVAAEFVALTLFDGEIGIAPGHSPMIGRLGSGELRISEGSQITTYYVEGGFVEVNNNTVSVLTQRAVPAADLDVAELEMALADARTRSAHSDEAMTARDRAVGQARAQLRVARRVI